MATLTNGIRDNDDPIVEEIPIYVAKRLAKRLFIFQYPLRPANKPLLSVQKAYFKPLHKEAKFEVTINTNSANFDIFRAEDLAKLVDSSEKEAKERIFSNNIIDKVIYTSNKTVHETSRYAIGAFNGHEFHLTPLEGYLQLRPSLDFIDKCMKQKKKDQSDENDDDKPVASVAEAVTVQFSKGDADKHLKAKELSYKQLKEKSVAEKWVECMWETKKMCEVEFLNGKLFAENLEDSGQMANLSCAEYIKLLVPEDEEQTVIKPSLPSHVVSLHALRSLPVQEQCRLLLKDTKMIQFQQLMLLLVSGKGITHDAVIKSLPQVALLVKGNWVVKSEILYPQNSFSAISGVSAEQMCKARDYVLYQFTQHAYVERRKVSQTIRLPAEEVKEIFTGVSRLKHNKGWELLLREDVEFLEKHPDIAERQKRLWEQRWQQLNDFYKDCPKAERKRKKSRSIGGDHELKSNEIRTEIRIKKESISDDADSGTEKKTSVVQKKHKKKHALYVPEVTIKTEIHS